MSADRVVPVPATSRAVHAVYTAEPVGTDHEFPAPSAALLRRFGASDDVLERLATRPHAHVIPAEYPTTEAAERVLQARRDALALAAEHDGVVVDLGVPRVVEESAGQTDLAVARQWVVIDLDAAGTMSSRGLAAFGLPEVRVVEVGPEQTAAVIAVLSGLAHRLVAEWPERDPVGPASVTLRDVAHGLGDHHVESAPRDRRLDLLIDHVDDALVVSLVDDPASLFG